MRLWATSANTTNETEAAGTGTEEAARTAGTEAVEKKQDDNSSNIIKKVIIIIRVALLINSLLLLLRNENFYYYYYIFRSNATYAVRNLDDTLITICTLEHLTERVSRRKPCGELGKRELLLRS